MALPVSDIVKINVIRDTIFPAQTGFGTETIVGISGVISTEQRIRKYANIKQVAEDFATDSEEYKAANSHYAQAVKPKAFYISRWVNSDTAAELRCGLNRTTDVDTWKAVSDGSFRIGIDGTSENVTALDFSSATSLDDVASTIQTALVSAGFTNATCKYNEKEKRFFIKSGTTGSSSTITYLSTATATVGTDISGTASGEQYLDGDSDSSSELNQGMAAESITDGLNTIKDKNNDWWVASFVSSIRDNDTAKEASAWAESQPNMVFIDSNDQAARSSSATSDIGHELKALNRFRTALFWHGDSKLYPSAALTGRALPEQPGSITWKFQNLSEVTPSTELKGTEVSTLTDKRYNMYVTYGDTSISQEGITCGGNDSQAEFIDTMRGIDWLSSLIQTNVFSKLDSPKKVPLTNQGLSTLESVMISALQEGERVGFLAGGVDKDGDPRPAFITSFKRVEQMTPSELSQRRAFLEFTAYLAGAIHFVQIDGTVTLDFN